MSEKLNYKDKDTLNRMFDLCPICGGLHPAGHKDNEIKALKAELDKYKELLKEGWNYKNDMLQWKEYNVWKEKVRLLLGER